MALKWPERSQRAVSISKVFGTSCYTMFWMVS